MRSQIVIALCGIAFIFLAAYVSSAGALGTQASLHNSYPAIADTNPPYLMRRGPTLDLCANKTVHSYRSGNILMASHGSAALPRITATGGSNHLLLMFGRGSNSFNLHDMEISTDSPNDDVSA
jgi:hypothetical protein